MRGRVQKWGNSLALRIPKSYAAEAGLAEDTPVEISVRKGKLLVQRAARSRLTLEELLAQVTEDNLHGEWQSGQETR